MPALRVSASYLNKDFLKTISKIKEAIRNLKVRKRNGVVNERAIFTAIKDEPQIIVIPKRYKSALSLEGIFEKLSVMKQSILLIVQIQDARNNVQVMIEKTN